MYTAGEPMTSMRDPKLTAVSFLTILIVACASLNGADSINIGMKDGSSMRGVVVKITKADVTLKIDGTEQILPLELLDPKTGVLVCYKAVGSKFDAALRKDMGAYFVKKKLYDEAEEELKAAVAIDGSLKAQVDPLLDQIKAAKESKEPPKPAATQAVADSKEKEKEKEKEADKSPGDERQSR